MKTSTIRYRVADFLKGWPPFSFLSQETLEKIAEKGRVRFHEKDEILFSEGDGRTHQFFVIQSGAVRLSRKVGGDEELYDLLGPGDLLGLGTLAESTEPHRHTATATADTLIYALDRELFLEMCGNSPGATRFLRAWFSEPDSGAEEAQGLGAAVHDPAGTGSLIRWYDRFDATLDFSKDRLIVVPPGHSIRMAARRMAELDADAVIVGGPDGTPLGIFTEIDLRDRVATGLNDIDEPVSQIMSRPVATIKREASVGECLLRMMRKQCRHLCVTADGTDQSAVTSVVSERDLTLFFGNNPMVILREIQTTDEPGELAALLTRSEALVLAGMRSAEDFEWYEETITEIQESIFRRVVEHAEASWLRKSGRESPPGHFVFALAGSAGRRERMTRTDLARILVHDDTSASENAWFQGLAGEVRQWAAAAGFPESPHGIGAFNPVWCRPLSEIRREFAEWIAHPVEQSIGIRLSLFDLSPLTPGDPLLAELLESIAQEITRRTNFIRLLANDSLENLPPVTIFQGYAVDAGGFHTDQLQIKAHATQPLVDVARVLHLESGYGPERNTFARLRAARERFPAQRELFTAGISAFRNACFLRTRIGLLRGDSGASIPVSALTRADQILLKTGFRAIDALLGFVSRHYGLSR